MDIHQETRWRTSHTEALPDELLELREGSSQSSGSRILKIAGTFARRAVERQDNMREAEPSATSRQMARLQREVAMLRYQLFRERQHNQDRDKVMQSQIDALRSMVVGQTAELQVAPMPALRGLREISAEGRQRFGFPFDVSGELTEADGAVIETASPPDWLTIHTKTKKEQRRH